MNDIDIPKEPENHTQMIGLFEKAITVQQGIRDNAINCIARYEDCIKQTKEQMMLEEAGQGNIIDMEIEDAKQITA